VASPLNRHFCAQIEWNLQYRDDVRIREFRSPLTCRTWLYSPLSQVRLPQQKRRWQLRHVYKYTAPSKSVERRRTRLTHAVASAHTSHIHTYTIRQPWSHEPAIDLHLRERESRASCITRSLAACAPAEPICTGVSLGFLINCGIHIFGLVFARIRCKFTPDNGVCSNRRRFSPRSQQLGLGHTLGWLMAGCYTPLSNGNVSLSLLLTWALLISLASI
jgi:hypothetical protein